jgi:carboxyl-terminal processing protease
VSRFFQRFVFVLSVAIFVSLGLGFALGEFGWFGVHAGDDQDGAYRQMRVYAEVLQKIQSDYVTDPNIGDVTTGALHGLLESLDADSSYLTPAEYKIFKDRPSSGDAQEGMTVSKRFGYATVVNVAPNSPAQQSHLADGDVIESIGGKSTHDLSLAVIRMMLEGKPGTTVR